MALEIWSPSVTRVLVCNADQPRLCLLISGQILIQTF